MLAGKGVAVDAADRVIDGGRGVRDPGNQLRGRGRVVVGVLGQAERVSLAVDGFGVSASLAGEAGLARGLVGARDGQVDVFWAVVLHDEGLAGEGGGGQGGEGCEGDGGTHGGDCGGGLVFGVGG